MSILIKGMEMPTSCENCRMWAYCPALPEREWPDFESILLNDVIGDGGTRHSDCPLVLVPPHGRLIDADAMRAQMPPCYTMEEIVKAFKNAPTIIPASEEGE